MAFPNLFRPIQLGNITLPNRIVHVPTDISSSHADGEVSERDIAHHSEVARGGAGLHARGAGLRVDLHAAHAGEVDDDGAIDHAVAAEAMAAAADGQRTVVVADEADRLDDVIRRRGADDGQRAAIVGDVVNLCAPRRSPWRWASRVRRRDRPGAIPDPARGSWRWCGES